MAKVDNTGFRPESSDPQRHWETHESLYRINFPDNSMYERLQEAWIKLPRQFFRPAFGTRPYIPDPQNDVALVVFCNGTFDTAIARHWNWSYNDEPWDIALHHIAPLQECERICMAMRRVVTTPILG